MARSLTPLLVVLIGLPGAGKSTLADALCARRSLARVDRDAIRAARFAGRRVSAAQKRIANELVWRRVRSLLSSGRDVLVDGMTFARAAERRRARALARKLGARVVEVVLACPLALAQRRVLRSRGHVAGDRTPALVREVARRFEPASRAALRLDARASAAVLARRAVAAIGA